MRLSRRRLRLHRRRHHPVRLAVRYTGQVLLPLAVVVAALAPPMQGTTLARISGVPGGQATQIRSLSSDVLGLSAGSLDLGLLTTGQTLDLPGVVVIHNRSGRVLPLTATITGPPGWTASINPTLLQPGETAQVRISGQAGSAGDIDGRLRIAAFGKFLAQEVPVKGRIQAEQLPAPLPSAIPVMPANGRAKP